MKRFEYICDACGETQNGAPSFSFRFPPYYFDIPETERAERVRVNDDFCEIDTPEGGTLFWMRVVIEAPIAGATEPFTWGVWVTQSAESFARYRDTFGQDQSADGSFGWLTVDLPCYNRTAAGAVLENLECDVQWGCTGQRPKAYLWESEHPLAVDQRGGISWDRAVEIATVTNAKFDGC
ncbi:MAG: DUF2199 domain-containing protein [Yoonia sp.]|nr:DUF2199 domain-containing protein [Yoonia sp.]